MRTQATPQPKLPEPATNGHEPAASHRRGSPEFVERAEGLRPAPARMGLGIWWLMAPPLLAATALACSDPGIACQVQGDWLVCPDGTKVPLHPRPHPDVPTGKVSGLARLFGRDDHSAITIRLVDSVSNRSTSAEVFEDGLWEAEVPAGIYDLWFEAPGYIEVKREQHLVAPGVNLQDPVELRSGIRLSETTPQRLVVSPDEGAFLSFLEGDPTAATLWEAKGGSVNLGGRTSGARFTPSGRSVVFLDEFDGNRLEGRLTIYDRQTKKRFDIADRVGDWKLTPDEAAVVIRQAPSRLLIWSRSDGITVLTDQLVSWELGAGGRTILFQTMRADGTVELIHWDIAAEGGTSLGGGKDPFVFSPDAQSFIYRTATAGSVLWDGLRIRPTFLGSIESAAFSPDGQWLAFTTMPGRALHLLEVASQQPFEMTSRSGAWAFSPGGEAFYFVSRDVDTSTEHLIRRELDGRGMMTIASDSTIDQLLFAPGPPEPGWLLVRSRSSGVPSPTTYRAWSETETIELGRSRESGTLRLSPNGRIVTFPQMEDFDVDERDASYLVVYDLDTERRAIIGPRVDRFTAPVWDPTSSIFHYEVWSNVGEETFVYDSERDHSYSLGAEVSTETCTFSATGSLTCFSRRSPTSGGSQLIRWDRSSAAVELLTDGVYSVAGSLDGNRLALLSQARVETEPGLLLLVDPEIPNPIAIDDRVRLSVVAPEWMAWVVEETSSRKGLYFTTYPRRNDR